VKKIPKGKIADLKFVKKNYIRDLGGCTNCGSEDLEFKKKKGSQVSFAVKCRECKTDLGFTQTIID